MCGRYRLSKRKQIIEEQFEAQPWGDDWSPRFNIAPTQRKGFGLRLQFPRWGKDKLAVLLRRQQVPVSTSMVGRVLTQLKAQGRLVEPPRSGVPGSRRALRPRPYAVRKPKQYAVLEPGDLVEVDTLDVRPVPGVVFKQFTARDLVSRWDVIQAHPRATAQSATHFSTPCSIVCLFPFAPCRSMAARSLPPTSKPPASSAVYICSCFRHARPNSMAPSNAPTAPTPKSSIRSPPARWK
jgi:hypothetical protein